MKYKTLYVGSKKQLEKKRKNLKPTKRYSYFIKDRGKNYALIRITKEDKKSKKKRTKNGSYYVRADDRFIVEDVSKNIAEEKYRQYKNFPSYDVIVLGYEDNRGYGRILKESFKGMEQAW